MRFALTAFALALVPTLAMADDALLAMPIESPTVASASTTEVPEDEEVRFDAFYHGFRLGYTYVNGVTEDSNSPLSSPHLFVIGYEGTTRVDGGEWLNVIVVGNASVAGLNQSLFIPSVNGLVGFEFADQFQIGTGVNLTPDPNGKYVHQIIAAGWTPAAGKLNVPVHFTVIPDVDGNWRVGTTVGVNW